MAPKRNDSEVSCEKVKRKRCAITLAQKIEILDKLKEGQGSTALGRHYGVNESTIRSIGKNEEAIRASVSSVTCPGSQIKRMTKRNVYMNNMEKLLGVWIEDEMQKGFPITGSIIRSKALTLYQSMCSQATAMPFNASPGWFDRFRKRHNIKLGINSSDADDQQTVANNFLTKFKKIVEENGYKPQQVFNVDETGLFFKRLPERILNVIQQQQADEDHSNKDRLSLLLCSNATGDCKCKPMLVYHTENPAALKGKQKAYLPVYWKSNSTAWVTEELFTDWFKFCFMPQVNEYLKQQNLPFKVLLLLDTIPAHPATLLHADKNVEVLFLPPNVSSDLHPMAQGVINMFKCYYTKGIFKKLLKSLNRQSDTIKDFWKTFNILNAIEAIEESWDEIQQSTLIASWSSLWPALVQDHHSINNEDEITEILKLAHEIHVDGFDRLQRHEIEDLLDSHQEELTEEELDLLHKSRTNEDNQVQRSTLTPSALQDIFKQLEEVQEKLVQYDPYMERSMKCVRALQEVMVPYREIYESMKTKTEQSSTPSTHRIKSAKVAPSPYSASTSSKLQLQRKPSNSTQAINECSPTNGSSTLTTAYPFQDELARSHPVAVTPSTSDTSTTEEPSTRTDSTEMDSALSQNSMVTSTNTMEDMEFVVYL